MPGEPTTLPSAEPQWDDDPESVLALTLVHAVGQGTRIGEVAVLQHEERVFGREGDLTFVRIRPGRKDDTGPISDPSVSRRQCTVRQVSPDRARLERLPSGKLPLRVNGMPTEATDLKLGDLVEVGDRMVLYLHRRPAWMPGNRPRHRFGDADEDGIVGEGSAIAELRQRIAFVAGRQPHVMVFGESGTGKELVARAVHRHSDRSSGPWVARNAATIPDSLADAELFGNLKNYPNPGMPERPGLVGEAHRGTLFLDEFGELAGESEARLLRVLDDGEYSRLGEAATKHTDLRLVAATNRALTEVKHDVLARMPLRIATPPLQDRREDIGLLVVHLLRAIARDDPTIAIRLFDDGDPTGFPRITTRLVATLVAHPYRTHVRELSMLLWEALAERPDGPLDLFGGYADRLAESTTVKTGTVDPNELTPEVIQACLDRHDGQQDAAWRELGLSSRYVLRRLVAKHGLRVRKRSPKQS